MLKICYRYFCVLSSISLVPWIYLIKLEPTELKVYDWLKNIDLYDFFNSHFFLYECCIYLLMLFMLLGLAYFTTLAFRFTPTTQLLQEHIESVDSAGDDMAMTYFGLFFYALSVTNLITLIFTFTLLSVGLMLSQRILYNPLYLFLGYRMYKVKTRRKTILILTKRRIAANDNVSFPELHKITELTYVEIIK